MTIHGDFHKTGVQADASNPGFDRRRLDPYGTRLNFFTASAEVDRGDQGSISTGRVRIFGRRLRRHRVAGSGHARRRQKSVASRAIHLVVVI
jgi:hypothetical protein